MTPFRESRMIITPPDKVITHVGCVVDVDNRLIHYNLLVEKRGPQ